MSDARNNLADFFFTATAEFGDRPAIIFRGGKITYDALRSAVLNAARNFQMLGVGPGEMIAVRTNDPVMTLVTVLAASLLRASWVAAHPAVRNHHAIRVGHWFESQKGELPEELDAVLLDGDWIKSMPGANDGFPTGSDDYNLFYTATSGTTGEPKFLALTNRNVIGRSLSFLNTDQMAGQPVAVFYGTQSTPFLARAMGVLIGGGRLICSVSPQIWERFNLHLVVGSVAQIQSILETEPPRSKLRRVSVGGAPVTNKFAHVLLDNFETVEVNYGATETSMTLSSILSRDDNGEIQSVSNVLDAELELVDDNDAPVARGNQGIVRVRTDYMVDGYIGVAGQPGAISPFRSGWFYPGDLAVWTEDGQFKIQGRINDQLNIGGSKLNAVLLDNVLTTVPGVDDAICFGMEQEDGRRILACFLKISPGLGHETVIAETKLQVTRLLGVAAVPKRIMISNHIPRNENGKPDRRACAAKMKQMQTVH